MTARRGEKYARVANACQAVEETRIAKKKRNAKMAPVSTFVTLPTPKMASRLPDPVGPMPCARASSTGSSALVLQIILETQRLSALKRKVGCNQ